MPNEDYLSNIIPTKNLKLEDVPRENDSWAQIERFALTFDRNEVEGKQYPRVSILKLLDENPDMSVVELRFLLFFEQRRWNHFHKFPDPASMKGIREIIVKIRKNL